MTLESPIDPKLIKRLSAFGEPQLTTACSWQGKSAALVISATHIAVVVGGMGRETFQSRLTHASLAETESPSVVLVGFYGDRQTIAFASPRAADEFRAVFARHGGVATTQAEKIAHEATRSILVVTTNELPGYVISDLLGDVYGITVRARNTFANMGANLRTVVGGEVGGYTKLLTEARREARQRMVDHARQVGANAVIAMRFDSSEIGDIMNEIICYGTAVVAHKNEMATLPPTPDPSRS